MDARFRKRFKRAENVEISRRDRRAEEEVQSVS
jgi:hypothetical protein